MLSEIQLAILELLLYDEEEPLEAIDSEALELEPQIQLDQVLSEILSLYKEGLVTIHQIPITALGQQFEKKELKPVYIAEIAGDLMDDFKEYSKSREYLNKFRLGEKPEETGVPFGIWIRITEKGKSVIEKLVD